MRLIPGGPFWAGSETETFDQEENPRFLTRLAPFCLDETEVTTSAYEACVDAGKCAPAERETVTCNFRRDGRGDHPINCIDYPRAEAVCASRGARLPSELEWEFAARGGQEQRKFSWGDEAPDGRTCWKANGTCKVKGFQPGAFGLYDVTGNVWEWTSDWFGHYPWPAVEGTRRVYRGGSWSRRFEKWLSPTLRNRSKPKEWGSHLGVRCALSPAGAECPYGRAESGACLRGVDDAQCLDGKSWNGIRCTTAGAPRCRDGSREVAGYGCVKDEAATDEVKPMDLSGVVRARSPEFDTDCSTNQPERPHAYRYTGGGHLERNQVEQTQGCKNRDVGVGWNSACCP